ncbi:MAG TPA: CarD family transcriptional regulator [Nitrosopumilaceae archaeon]|nr:CarD family transcriptional regulator [Nitrosopumilaceae archaeon]
MFARNEKVVYPGHGVAVINCVIEKKIAGRSLQFFELRFLNKDMTILVPTNNATEVGIRPLSSTEYINEIFKLLAQPIITKQLDSAISNWNKRNKEYQGKLRSGNLLELCAIYRDLRHIENNKELSFGEKSLLQQTENLLSEEISIVTKINVNDAAKQLKDLVKCKKNNEPSSSFVQNTAFVESTSKTKIKNLTR